MPVLGSESGHGRVTTGIANREDTQCPGDIDESSSSTDEREEARVDNPQSVDICVREVSDLEYIVLMTSVGRHRESTRA